MKKALALVLALVLALSMAVSAFALTELKPAATKVTDGRIDVTENALSFTTDGKADSLYCAPVYGGETYYLLVEDTDLKNVAVSATGALEAKVVKYDPYTMKGAEVNFYIVDATENVENLHKAEEIIAKFGLDVSAAKYTKVLDVYGENSVQYLDLVVAAANKVAKYNRFSVVADTEYYVVVLTVEENYTVATKMGSFKVTADQIVDKKTSYPVASDLIYVFTDVVIFEYEEVKYAANYDDELVLGSKGYSALLDANYTEGEYNVEALRNRANATVVSTTAFRAIAGKDLTIAAGAVEVTLKAVAEGQKGVNFACSGVYAVDANGLTAAQCAAKGLTFYAAALNLDFYGEQVIKGEYEIAIDLDYDWYELRQLFELQLEEEDIITYYVLKDGKVIDSITVDYMTADIDEEIELVIKGANSALGSYALALEVPAAEVETEVEENPNTGAESVVGVVAALAVVSLASAAAVSLKK